MKPSEDLFNLINSLSKAEKRYFNINFLQKSENKNYSRLFREIEFQVRKGNYDEAKIKEKFKNEKFIKQLTFTKNYLYSLIVKSLINFYSPDNLEIEIYNLITSAKIFFRKALFPEYFKALEKAKILAEETEKFGILIDIIKLQTKLVRLKDRKKYKNRNLYKDEENAIIKIKNISEYSYLLHIFYRITKIPDYARSRILYKEAEKIFFNKLLDSDKSALSVTAKDMFYILSIYKYDFLNDKQKLFETSLKRYQLFKDNEKVFRADSSDKETTLLFNALHDSLEAGKINYFRKNFPDYKELLTKVKSKHNDRSANVASLNLYYNYFSGNISEAVKFAKEVYIFLKATEKNQTKDDLLQFYFFYAKLLFENMNYEEALEVVNEIITHEYKDVRIDILSYSYFLSLFIHYELKNYQLIHSLIRTLKRKISQHKEKNLSEKIILKFFTEITSDNLSDEKFILQKYLKQFTGIKKSKYEELFFRELPIDSWILKKST